MATISLPLMVCWSGLSFSIAIVPKLVVTGVPFGKQMANEGCDSVSEMISTVLEAVVVILSQLVTVYVII